MYRGLNLDITRFSMDIAIGGFHHFKVVNGVLIPMVWEQSANEGLVGRTSDSCGGPGAVRANQGCQVHGVSSDTLVRLASRLDACCVKKQCG